MSEEVKPIDAYNEVGPRVKCIKCESLFFNDFKFCPACGVKKEANTLYEKSRASITSDTNFISFISYFFISVALLAFYKFSEFSSNDSSNFFIMLILFAGIDLGYIAFNGVISIPLSVKKIKGLKLLQMLGVLLVSAVIVHYVASYLNSNIFDQYIESEYLTWDNLWLAIILISLYPAFFEEMIYRGVLFHNMEKLSNKRTALIVSSLVFGLTHLTFVSLIWLIPLGLLFGVYRSKYDTLWYGIIGHFFYNTVITVLGLIL